MSKPDKAILISPLILALAASFILPEAGAFELGNAALDITADAGSRYDSNITYAHTNVKSDLVGQFKLGADLGYEGKTRQFKLGADISRNEYLDNNNFSNTAENVTFDLKNEFSKYDRISVSEAFSHTLEPQNFEDAFGRTQGLYSYYRNDVSASYEKDITEQFGTRIYYANQANYFSQAGLTDSWLNDVGIDAVYNFSTATALIVGYEFLDRSFEHNFSTSTNSLQAGIRQYFTEKLYFDGRAGADLIRDFEKNEITKPMLSASLTDEWNERTRVSVSVLKRYDTTTYQESLFDETRLSLNASHDLTPRLSVNGSLFAGEGKYLSADRTDKDAGVSVSLSYELRRNLKANLSYAFSSVNSNIDTDSYAKHVISLGITAVF